MKDLFSKSIWSIEPRRNRALRIKIAQRPSIRTAGTGLLGLEAKQAILTII